MTDTGDDIRVLHVDDNTDFLEVVATYLENEDDSLEVVSESSAQAGLDRLGDEQIDCVVSDYKMPELDGLEFLEAVTDEYPGMPFILYTGHGSEEIASEAISAGVTEYMQKETGTDQYTVLANTIVNAVEHDRVEDALRESEERYRTLVEQSHDGIYIYRDSRFEFVNDRVCEITGYEKETLYDLDVLELIHPDDRERVAEIGRRRQAGKDAPNRYEARIVTANEETRHLEFSVQTITYEGEYAGMGSVRDVTDRHRNEQRLEEFASIVAHDLRNPLNVIAGRIELAEKTGDDVHFEAIERSVTRIEALLADMRELASQSLPVHEADVVGVGEAATEAWANGERADATLLVSEDLPTVQADADRLERLLAELFDNAVQHGDSRTVSVESAESGFAVVDDGSGIRESERERAFEAGYSTETDRTGFGLAVADWIADAHGWELSISESDAGGTRVTVERVVEV